MTLRICRVCGLEAHTEEDLELFKKDKRYLHRRQNICTRCSNEPRCRTAEFIEVFRSRGPDGFRCHFCGELVTKLEELDEDSLAIHSLDGDHENWSSENKVPAHRGCHSSHHSTGEQNPMWKGAKASDHAKRERELRRMRGIESPTE